MYDADIEALAESAIHTGPSLWTLESFHTSAGTGTIPTAAVRLRHADGRRFEEASCGDGPVDAVFKSIERITGMTLELRDYSVRSVTVGEDAQGEAKVVVLYNDKSVTGRAVSTDVMEASALAFLHVINRIALRQPTPAAPCVEAVPVA